MFLQQARCFVLLLVVSMLTACSSGPRPAVLTSQSVAYSLATPDTLPASYTIPLETRHGFVFVRGRVNNERAGLFLFDTGSNLNILDQGVANRLQLPTLDQRTTVGIAGTADFTVRPIDRLTLGDLDLGINRLGVLSMLPLTRGIGMNPAGLIGFTALANQPFTLDYEKKQLTVYRRDAFTPPPEATRVPLTIYRGLPAVLATLGGGQEVLLLLDSGADNAITLPATAAYWPGILSTGTTGAGVSRGVGGEVRTQRGWLRRVDVFELQLRDVPVTFEPPPPGLTDPRIPIGRVGNELLSSFRLTFDARRRTLWVEFLPESR